MYRLYLLLFNCLFLNLLQAQEISAISDSLNNLIIAIRDNKISKEKARQKLDYYLKEIDKQHKPLQKAKKFAETRLIFPLAGYGPAAIGGKNGDGYKSKGYDFFDGNKHKGHPAHDIFISDKNQDGLEDKTNREVKVIASMEGIVIALERNWNPTSLLRGGNYIWIYNPFKKILLYYGHNNKVMVEPGSWVNPGDEIATVGRTGFNAYKKRSPTHLHFSVFKVRDGIPVPFNPYHLFTTP